MAGRRYRFDPRRPGVREAMFWKPLGDGRVVCNLCHKRCIIAPGAFGACGVRYNHNGKLYTLVYGLLTAANPDPIEKKPLMHFNPGACVFSISTAGCNFYCKFCQNWVLSQSRYDKIFGEPYDPEEVVKLAIENGCQGISYTYNEPTIFYEFMYDTAKLAKKEGLFNTMVTNGYMTPEAIKELGPYMDAATVDFKGGGNKEFYRKFMGVLDPEPIFDSILAMKKEGWWIEITNLVVPKYGDKEEDIRKLARWIVENLGDETPFHLLRFHPDYKLQNLPPTPLETLEKLAKIAMEEGLKHVYIGNVGNHPLENTYCPRCGELVVKRLGFYIVDWRLTKDFRCPRCGYKLNFKGKFWGSRSQSFLI
ncbi:AmmeMemoRadiSam system radical SAM enzyme [Staphylothermus hellenicus]|uniref:Radical SAM domain protein n=1 Tax=Staphylothermus hellenicus (strain DSM 12710 / JCM 10830 / BK20S6-10-b1 / P8) TaxID=591019 RepID=D7D969_STAHD|nr:AmmeMemoRadiSam system radical SAM enzyme [Staphylothermus hellenicus]ADI32315.1 Radical SAM domain protein [Staphylothermus hellenicus DSM 12710]